MRMSILNTATTEQMGYGIISFFVCSLMNEIVKSFCFNSQFVLSYGLSLERHMKKIFSSERGEEKRKVGMN